MKARPYKEASCLYCKEKFDRNKIPFVVSNPEVERPRYLHAKCAEAYQLKSKRTLGALIDPNKEFMCEFCHTAIPAGQEVTLPGDRFAHVDCYSKDNSHGKSDYDKLFEYIMSVYDESFVNPAKQKAIEKMIKDHGFTHSGIHGTLVYLYEILKKRPQDSNYLGIVPWYYTEAKEYFTNKAKVNAENAKKDIENYKPKQIVVKTKERERVVQKKKFSVLDEENVDAE
jgi:hypothetical protein